MRKTTLHTPRPMKEGERCSRLQIWDSSAGHGEAVVPQKPMEIHGNIEIHLQPVEKPYARVGG